MEGTSGLMVTDHTGFVKLSGSCHDQLTLVKLQVRILLCIMAGGIKKIWGGGEGKDKSEK